MAMINRLTRVEAAISLILVAQEAQTQSKPPWFLAEKLEDAKEFARLVRSALWAFEGFGFHGAAMGKAETLIRRDATAFRVGRISSR